MNNDDNLIDFFSALKDKKTSEHESMANGQILMFINNLSSDINEIMQQESVNKEFLVYLIFNRLIKILDYLPTEKKEEILYSLLSQLSEAESQLKGAKNENRSGPETNSPK